MIGYCPSAGPHPATSSTFVFNRFHRPLRKSVALARHARVSLSPSPFAGTRGDDGPSLVPFVSGSMPRLTPGGKKKEERKKREKEKKKKRRKLCPRRGRTWPDRFIAATSRIPRTPRFFSSLFAKARPLSISLPLSLSLSPNVIRDLHPRRRTCAMRIQSRDFPDAHRNPFAELKGRTRPRLAETSNAITIYSLCVRTVYVYVSFGSARDKIPKRERFRGRERPSVRAKID